MLTSQSLDAALEKIATFRNNDLMKADVTLIELSLGYFRNDLNAGNAPTLGELHEHLREAVKFEQGAASLMLVEPQSLESDDFVAREGDIDHSLNVVASSAFTAAANALDISVGQRIGE